ncbi:MAG TPA: hypothetical protein VFT58_01405, partial [Nitrososphaera sp.]|nr:hypothetical protein [Nitrososphaera sp.]
MEEVDAANKAKAQLASRTAAIVHDSERAKAMLGESQRRISDIERRLPQIEGGKQAIARRAEGMKADAEKIQTSMAQKKEALATLRTRLDQINVQVEEVSAVISRYTGLRQKLEGRLKRVSSLGNSVEMSAARVEEKIKTNAYKKDAGDSALASLASEVDSAKTRISELQKSLESDRLHLQETTSTLDALTETKAALERELADSAAILSKADTMATKFEERASVAKHAMNEDFAIAELTKYSEKFGIKGIVHDLIRWDKGYERAVLASGSEWMKAFVVEDVKSMIAIAAYAKEKKLPRLRIIPLDIVGRHKTKPAKEFKGDTNVVGRVSDFVYSEYEALPEFLFSDAIVVRNSSAAYALARQGFRTVSVEGELFEPEGGSMALDFGSKISDLTKAIILGDSVESLLDMLSRLSKVVEKKNAQLREAAERIASAEGEKIRLEIQISSSETRLAQESSSVVGKEKTLLEMQAHGQALVQEAELLVAELERYRRRLALISPTVNKLSSRLQGIDESAAKAR